MKIKNVFKKRTFRKKTMQKIYFMKYLIYEIFKYLMIYLNNIII